MELLTQADIERRILEAEEALASETVRYGNLADKAADAEATYKYKLARTWVDLAKVADAKYTVVERNLRADLAASDEFRAWRVMEAARGSSKESLLSLRARLDALRTLSANVRHLT